MKRKKVAILGGGIGALSTAFWLASTPELRREYELTVYTHGWRLGGKAASGRNSAHDNRTEEHGLHMLMGFYETAFHVIRACYGAMRMPDNPVFPGWEQAFAAHDQVTFWLAPDVAPVEEWTAWNIRGFPRYPGVPGDGPLSTSLDSRDILRAARRGIKWLLQHVLDPLRRDIIGTPFEPQFDALYNDLRNQSLAPSDTVSEADRQRLETEVTNFQAYLTMQVNLRSATPASAAPRLPLDFYKLRLLADIGLAALRGFFADRVYTGDPAIRELDRQDFKKWLRDHGASKAGVQSAVVMWIYDLTFAYENGDSSTPDKGKIAAGATLLLLLRMAFTYKQAPLWKMKAGMGDAIFTPLFRLLDRDAGTLKEDGVRFEFFHRVRELKVSENSKAIDEIAIDVQAIARQGPYQPLIPLRFANGNWECWPAQPDWEQLEGNHDPDTNLEDPADSTVRGTRTLKRGTDFDIVVLALPPAAALPVTRQLCTADRAWRSMIDESDSVATQSVQLWLEPKLRDIGWKNDATVSTCHADPLRSWGEMSQVLETESWSGTPPRSCQYLCGTYRRSSESEAPEDQERRAREWLEEHAHELWPNAANREGVNRGRGLDPSLLRSSYFRVNAAGSDLFVQTMPGSVDARLGPHGGGFENLYIAGDWTITTINGGCAEAAFESGLRAACAIARLSEPPVPKF